MPLVNAGRIVDDRKIGGALAQRFPTNWELAAARAARVVRLLETKGQLSQAVSQDEKLTDSLREARDHIAALVVGT